MLRVSEKWMPPIIFFGLLTVYLGFLTRNYYWDGIYFAFLIEQADSLNSTLIHPNHPFYNPFGYLVYKLFQAFGADIRAVTVLQIINCVLSALASSIFYLILRRNFRSAFTAVMLTLLFAFSATWWKFSTDADAYYRKHAATDRQFFFYPAGAAPDAAAGRGCALGRDVFSSACPFLFSRCGTGDLSSELRSGQA